MEYLKIKNDNEELLNDLDNKITSHGANKHNKDYSFVDRIENELDGFNKLQFFSLSKLPDAVKKSQLKYKRRQSKINQKEEKILTENADLQMELKSRFLKNDQNTINFNFENKLAYFNI